MDKRTKLFGSPRKCGWSAVQTKVSIAARILLRLPQAGKAKPPPAMCVRPTLARATSYVRDVVGVRFSASTRAKRAAQPLLPSGVCSPVRLSFRSPDAQTRKNHPHHPGRRKFAKPPVSKSASPFQTSNRIRNRGQQLFFLRRQRGRLGLGCQAHPADSAETFPDRNKSKVAARPTHLPASCATKNQERRVPDLSGGSRLAHSQHAYAIGARLPLSFRVAAYRDAALQRRLRTPGDCLGNCPL